MKTFLLVLTLLFPIPALASPLTFEVGGQTGQSLSYISPQYGGASWDAPWSLVTQQSYALVYGNAIAFPSGTEALFNGYGAEALTIHGAGMTATGAWFAPWTAYDAWYTPYSSTFVTVEGYIGSTLIGIETLQLDPSRFLYLPMTFGPIDALRIMTNSGGPHWYLMDNLDLTVPIVAQPAWTETTVPEPATIFYLLAAGLASWLGYNWLRLWRSLLWTAPAISKSDKTSLRIGSRVYLRTK